MSSWLDQLQLSSSERDALLMALTASPAQALAIADASGKILYANRSFAELTGMSEESLAGVGLHDLFAFERVDKLMAEARAGGSGPQELEMRRLDGKTLHVGGGLSWMASTGRSLYVLSLQDHSARREAEDRFRSLYAHLSHGVLLFDESTLRCEEANEAAMRMLRYPELEAIRGLTPWDFTVDLGKANDVVDAILKSAPAPLQIPVEKLRRRDGSQFPAMLSLGWFHSMSGRKVFAIVEDITARVRDERRLRRLLRLRRLATACSQRSARAVNEAELYEAFCLELCGQGAFAGAWIATLPTEASCDVTPLAMAGSGVDAPKLREVMQRLGAQRALVCEAIRGGTPYVSRHLPDDSSFEPWRALEGVNAVALLPVRLGEEYPLLLVVHAVSEESFNEDEMSLLVELCSDLAFGVQRLRLESRHRELEALLRQSQKMEAIGTFAGGVAHDFNNLLASISGNLFLAQDGAALDPVTRERLQQAEDTCFRAAERISQLLIFARKGVINRTPQDLVQLMQQSASMFELTVPKNIELRVRLPEEFRLVAELDTVQVQQLILNLLSNARDALEGFEDPWIELRVEEFLPDGDWRRRYPACVAERFVQIDVEDNGSGIAPQHLDQIFEPFFTTKAVGRGTGLGLSMVYGAVQEHGGGVEVASTVNLGTMVRVWLPLSRSEPVSASPSKDVAPPQRAPGTPLGILVVDDDVMVRQVQLELLRALGFTTFGAENGAEALQVYRANADHIDAVVMDVVMPVLGGVPAARRLRELREDLPILFASGYDEQHTLDDVAELPNIAIAQKPIRARELADRLRKMIG